MGNTTNHNIYFLSNGDPQSQITESATQAGTIETALDSVSGDIESVNNFGVQYFANASARDLALVSPTVGWLTQLDSELFMRRWDGAAWKPFGSGEFPVRPSSVSGTGVTISPDGSMLVASGSSPRDMFVNGVFSSDFPNYRVHWLLYGASAAVTTAFSLSAGGTANATGYDSVSLYGQNSAAGSGPAINATAWLLSSEPNQDLNLYLSRPAENAQTTGTASGLQTPNPGTAGVMTIQNFGVLHRASYPADGLKIALSNAATGVSARLRIYGTL